LQWERQNRDAERLGQRQPEQQHAPQVPERREEREFRKRPSVHPEEASAI
jgi:hypothetical protein